MARHLGESRGRSGIMARVLPVILMVAGLFVVLVPLSMRAATDWRNARAVSALSGVAQMMDEDERTALLDNAHAYNDVLAGVSPSGDVMPYERQLDAGDAAIAWMEVPKIGLELLIYRGTETEALAAGVGHLEGSSLPVGGVSTHCVLTGHSGLATSRMFDDIRQLGEGDTFSLHVLGEELTYEVYATEVVLPDEMDSLAIVPGEDLVTLVTCTPYGVNDHRLLVHARRCEPAEESTNPVGKGRDVPWWPIPAALLVVGVVGLLRGRKSHLARD